MYMNLEQEKKYELAKDLPFAKVGTVLSTTSHKKGERVYIEGETFKFEKDSLFLGWASELLAEGWIRIIELKLIEQKKYTLSDLRRAFEDARETDEEDEVILDTYETFEDWYYNVFDEPVE